jgi:microcystin-dependent protein
MHKIDGAGHINNLFVPEDALLNRPPTEITADWLNALQMEIANVITWAEINLNKSDNTQLLAALQAKFAVLAPSGDYATKSAVQLDDYKIADADVVGSADALVASYFPAITDLSGAHGMVLHVRARAANTSASPTFTPNNGVVAAKTIVKGNLLPLVAGDIAGAGFWAELRYDYEDDNWVLLNPAKGLQPEVQSALLGEIRYVCQANAPAGWLKANGVAISRTTYSALFGVVGTMFGPGNGSTTFNLPDLRGEFIRGLDDGRGVDAGRGLGSKQKGSLLGYDKFNDAVFGLSTTSDVGSTSQTVVGVDAYDVNDYVGARLRGATDATSNTLPGASDGASGGYSGVSRPRNIALLPIIYTGVF